MIKFSFCLLLLLAANYSASAQLGETQAQMEARYGKGKELPPPPADTLLDLREEAGPKLVSRIYTDGDYTILACFLHGKCAREDYNRTDGKELTREELQTLLNYNRLGSKWQEIDSDNLDSRMWKLSNGGASALYRIKGLTITTREFDKTFPALHRTR